MRCVVSGDLVVNASHKYGVDCAMACRRDTVSSLCIVLLCLFGLVHGVTTFFTNPYPRPPRTETQRHRLGGPVNNATWRAQVDALDRLFIATGGHTSWRHTSGWTPQIDVGSMLVQCDLQHTANGAIEVIPGVFCQNSAITKLDFTGFNLVGEFPSYAAFFAPFAAQGIDFIFDNNPSLGGQLPTGFPRTYQMSVLQVAQCNLTGSIPDDIFLPTLTTLALNNNRLVIDPLSPAVGNATTLQWLYIGGNLRTGGELPDTLCRCPLQGLDLTGPSGFTGLPSCFGSSLSSTLILLNLYDNKFSGPIPRSWCKLTKLQHLYLQLNVNLNGELPDCIQYMSSLISLAVINTQVGGPFPRWLFNMTSLENLLLAVSQFSGHVPDEFDRLPALTTLSLGGGPNKGVGPTFDGPLPLSIFRLSKLTVLELYNTNIQGSVPSLVNLPLLCLLYINENPLLSGRFPTELLTDVWITKIDPKKQMVPRAMTIAISAFAGALPQITDTQAARIQNINTAAAAFDLSSDGWYGYISESVKLWLPQPSWKNVFINNPQVYYPVPPDLLMMTGGFAGTKCALSDVSGLPWNADGGANVTLAGSFGASNTYKVAFYSSLNSTAEIFGLPDVEAWDARIADVAVELPWGFPEQTPIISAVATIVTPPFDLIGAPSLSVWLTLFETGLVINGSATVARVTDSTVSAQYYNPRPFASRVAPDVGRYQGCTEVTLIGRGFLNAPLPQVVLRSLEAPALFIEGESVSVVSDTQVTFAVPPANASDFNDLYSDRMGNLTVIFYPAGTIHRHQVSTSEARYAFEMGCAALVKCFAGHTDPESCPIEPLCSCSSRGSCNATSSSCNCDVGFTGALCENCTTNRYGPSCQECACVHGVCAWGIDADGSCACDPHWMGSTCALNTTYLISGICVGAAVLFVAGGLGVRRLRRGKSTSQATINNESMPLVTR